MKKAFAVGNKCFALVVSLAIAGLAQHSAFAAYNAAGGYVTLLSDNLGSQSESTFMTNIVKATSYGWSDGQDPHSGTNYYCKYQLCSPKITNGTFKFPGDSLTIGNASQSRLIVLATSTLDIDDFRLEERGYVMTYGNNALQVTFRGNLTILGDASRPSYFELGTSPQWYKVESALKGDSSAFAYSSLKANKSFTSFGTQYVELDDADEYYGTFEVRTNTCLKLASDLPGIVAVANGGCLNPMGAVTIGTLSLSDGATVDFSGGGAITVVGGFTALGKIKVKVDSGNLSPQAVLVVPAGNGTIETRSFSGNDGMRFTVRNENGVQTLYVEVLEPATYDATTGYVTLDNDEGDNEFDNPDLWSDKRVPHSDTNYYAKNKYIAITTNSVFAGNSLTIEWGSFRIYNNKTVTIPDLRVRPGYSASSGMFTSMGGVGRYYIAGSMAVLSKLTDSWPFAFYGGLDGQTWISSQKITGSDNSAFVLRGNVNQAPGAVSSYTEFLGDLSEYFGTIIIGTNSTARLGGSVLPGTIRLDTAYSHVDTMAADGAEVKIGKLESLISTSISVAETNTLAVTDELAVSGTLTKNGAGVFAADGVVSAGASAALNIAAGGLRADSAHAFDGIPITFADGTKYVRDCASVDAELVQYGLYNTSSVTAAGVLNVEIKNFSEGGMAREVAILTVPSACADALLSAIRFSPRPKGCNVEKIVADAGNGQKTIKAVLSAAGMTIIFR